MELSKKTVVDKMEIMREKDHYILQVREAIQFCEDDKVVSQNFLRSSLHPNHDVSTITDTVVRGQFNAIMTDEVKANYTAFKKAQEAKMNPA